jgi:hypothetical protein
MFKTWKRKFASAAEQIRFLKYERNFGERDDDVYIAGFPRSGNTLLQVISYHLTHDGGMDYNHLDDVSPWLRNLASHKLPVPEIASPRVIKTHDPYSLVPPDKQGRFIFVQRDAADAAVSLFHHWKNYNDPALKFEEVFDKMIRSEKPTAYFEFNRAWMENKKGLPILYLRYEEVLANKHQAIKSIACFLKVELNESKTEEVIHLSSFENMKRNQNKFGEQPKERLPGLVYDQFIRHGKPGEGKVVLSKEQLEYCRKKSDVSFLYLPNKPSNATKR